MNARLFSLLFGAASLLSVCCGGSKSGQEKTVLAEAGGPGDEPGAGRIEEMIEKDAHKAAQVIRDALESSDPELAAWAAVHALRLDIRHDRALSNKALIRGIKADDPLLQALCWRWLAAEKEVARIPAWPGGEPKDTVIGAMAAVSQAAKGSLPGCLASALGLPQEKPRGQEAADSAKKRVGELSFMASPYDNGPLALAIAFVEARRLKWVEPDSNRSAVWSCERLRATLIRNLRPKDEKSARTLERSPAPRGSDISALATAIDTPLLSRPGRVLRMAALKGEPKLRREALRAIAATAREPLAGDFGAAATALDSEDPETRLDGARTFLLLTARAQR